MDTVLNFSKGLESRTITISFPYQTKDADRARTTLQGSLIIKVTSESVSIDSNNIIIDTTDVGY